MLSRITVLFGYNRQENLSLLLINVLVNNCLKKFILQLKEEKLKNQYK